MIQSGGIFGNLTATVPQVNFLTGKEVIKKVYHQHQNQPQNQLKKQQNIMLILNELKKQFTSSKGSGITLTNNEIKNVTKVIKSFENRSILLKGTTRKIASPEGGF